MPRCFSNESLLLKERPLVMNKVFVNCRNGIRCYTYHVQPIFSGVDGSFMRVRTRRIRDGIVTDGELFVLHPTVWFEYPKRSWKLERLTV